MGLHRYWGSLPCPVFSSVATTKSLLGQRLGWVLLLLCPPVTSAQDGFLHGGPLTFPQQGGYPSGPSVNSFLISSGDQISPECPPQGPPWGLVRKVNLGSVYPKPVRAEPGCETQQPAASSSRGFWRPLKFRSLHLTGRVRMFRDRQSRIPLLDIPSSPT